MKIRADRWRLKGLGIFHNKTIKNNLDSKLKDQFFSKHKKPITMIRQLPRLSLPSFLQNYVSESAIVSSNETTDVKIYDVITEMSNADGNTMQL